VQVFELEVATRSNVRKRRWYLRMQKRRLNVARVPKGERLGPKPAKDSSRRGHFAILLLPPSHSWPSSVSSSSLSFKIAIYRSTRHLSPFRGAPRTRAFCLHLGTGHRNSRRNSLVVSRRRRNSGEGAERRVLALWNISPHRSFKTTRVWDDGMSSRETAGRSSIFSQPCYFEEVSPRIHHETETRESLDKNFFFLIVLLKFK